MNPFMLPEKDRMLSWRELRRLVSSLPSDIERLEEVIRWWAKAPICRFSIDPWDSTEWPTPWELLNEGKFCTNGIAYMTAKTLIFAGFEPERITMPFIRTSDDERLIVVVDGRFVLNFSYGEIYDVNDISGEFVVVHTFVFDSEHPTAKLAD